MRKSVFELVLLILLAASANTVQAEVHLRIKATAGTNAVYRGVTISSRDTVLQGSAELQGESGWYVGAWASQVAYESDDREYEIDYYAGLHKRWTDDLALDVTLLRYTFDADVRGASRDWSELQLATHIGDRWTVLATAGDDWLGRKARHYVLEATYRHPLPLYIIGYATIGHQFVKDVIDDEYTYREAGLVKSFKQFDFRLAYADITGIEPFGPYSKSEVTFAVSRAFLFTPFARRHLR